MAIWRRKTERPIEVVGVFRTIIGGPETTDEIVKNVLKLGRELGRVHHIDDRLTQTNFPVYSLEKPKEAEIEVVNPHWYDSDKRGYKEYLAVLRRANLERPTYEHAMRLFGQHAAAIIAHPGLWGRGITFPHEPRIGSYGERYLMCFWCYRNSLGVDLEENLGKGFFGLPGLVAGIRRSS